ncbi:MAG: hypothetical protein ACREUC_09910, partial [Steroidobacteraceae bacterium]
VKPLQFVLAIGAARGARYLALGILAIYYGDAALELMRTQGRTVALALAGFFALSLAGWWAWNRLGSKERPSGLH